MVKIILIVLFSLSNIYADELDDILQELRANVHKAVIANTNALMVFTSQDMISSGKYKIEGTQNNSSLNIINFPFLYHFKNDSFYNFFVLGSLGRSVMDTKVSVIEDSIPDETSFETYIAKIGGGIRIKDQYGFEALLGVSIIYSHIYNNYEFKNEISDIYKEIFEDEFANKSLQNISYDLYLEFAYRPNFDGWKPYAVLNYNYYDTKSLKDIDELGKFTTRSSVTALHLGMESAELFDIYMMPVTFEFYTAGSIVTGDIETSLEFNGYGELGTLLHLYLKDKQYPITEVYIGYSEVHSNKINGYNLGFGLGLSF
jgi:hypothetical protein